MTELWRSLFRIVLGGYWLYFASQKWPAPYGLAPHGIEWVHGYLVTASQTSPVPGMRSMLTTLVLPQWQVFVIAQTVGETAVGVLLIIGLATRAAGLVGTLLAVNLSLTIAFLDPDVAIRWLYYLPIAMSFEVFVNGPGSLALSRVLPLPPWLR